MEKITCKTPENQFLFHCFFSIEDPRVKGRCTYPLINILVMTLCALIANCDDWESIALFAKERRRWLNQFIDMSLGIPSPLTFARVFSIIDPKAFQTCLQHWVAQITSLVAGDMIAIDGKTARGSSRKQRHQKGIHMVNAYVGNSKTTLASMKVPDKSNEIKAIPDLLKTIDPAGCIITIDAMGTQKGIAKLIRKKQAHYVLCLKDNHHRFHRKVRRLFQEAASMNVESMVIENKETNDYGHARIEERTYTILPMMYLRQYKQTWTDLTAFIQVKRVRHLASGEIEQAACYYITSIPFKKTDQMLQAIRGHWQVENGLHYRLDVGMAEDASQIARGHAAENLSIMRKLVLKLLDNETSYQAGVRRKRKRAALSTRYLRKVVGF